ncbi:putative male-specific lethal 3 [Monocercomonoides exilis]|uniref:putative male-specific lethal 3 n=1 Tax=Monocercomonoides exilis TaxID=2049356 RepID=UPI003559BF39|nr:putative male-specific lethal 3 [Monocercomonoides exilis]|eukprot:MONOS_14650.1-p1 / transcript=MONOS_14650.1 / gene=MONOS_14650 / organism=Monocercomonoides_exilis_PA203 / gene_product=unspecified product / transcript_product=unspecified product / location=Mono_scaffold01042:836-6333(+) / protein_length=1453 / sequence_SO=supercontig / SO=protein_coding / is_pseudo=false
MSLFQKKETVYGKSGCCYYRAIVIDILENRGIPLYRLHYHGWSASHDEWVSEDNIIKNTKENAEMAKKLYKDELKKEQEAKSHSKAKKKSSITDIDNSVNDAHDSFQSKFSRKLKPLLDPPNENQSIISTPPLPTQEIEIETMKEPPINDSHTEKQETNDVVFEKNVKEIVKTPMFPLLLRNRLYDDYMSMMQGKESQILVLPCKPNITTILNSFIVHISQQIQKAHEDSDSSEKDSKRNVDAAIGFCDALKLYFNTFLGQFLLTDVEVLQYHCIEYFLMVNRMKKLERDKNEPTVDLKKNAKRKIEEEKEEDDAAITIEREKEKEKEKLFEREAEEKDLSAHPLGLSASSASASASSSSTSPSPSPSSSSVVHSSFHLPVFLQPITSLSANDRAVLSSFEFSPFCSLSSLYASFSSSNFDLSSVASLLALSSASASASASVSESGQISVAAQTFPMSPSSSSFPEQSSSSSSTSPQVESTQSSSEASLSTSSSSSSSSSSSNKPIKDDPSSPANQKGTIFFAPMLTSPSLPLPFSPNCLSLCDVYGGIHLLRLLIKLPFFINKLSSLKEAGFVSSLVEMVKELTDYLALYEAYIFTESYLPYSTLSSFYLSLLRLCPNIENGHFSVDSAAKSVNKYENFVENSAQKKINLKDPKLNEEQSPKKEEPKIKQKKEKENLTQKHKKSTEKSKKPEEKPAPKPQNRVVRKKKTSMPVIFPDVIPAGLVAPPVLTSLSIFPSPLTSPASSAILSQSHPHLFTQPQQAPLSAQSALQAYSPGFAGAPSSASFSGQSSQITFGPSSHNFPPYSPYPSYPSYSPYSSYSSSNVQPMASNHTPVYFNPDLMLRSSVDCSQGQLGESQSFLPPAADNEYAEQAAPNDLAPSSGMELCLSNDKRNMLSQGVYAQNIVEMIPSEEFFDIAVHQGCSAEERNVPAGELLVSRAARQLSSYLRSSQQGMQAYIRQIIQLFQLDEEVFLTAVVILFRYVKSARAFLKVKQESELYYLILLSVVIACKALLDIPINSGQIARFFQCDPSNVFRNEVQIMKSLGWSIFYGRGDLEDDEKALALEANGIVSSSTGEEAEKLLFHPLSLSTIVPVDVYLCLTCSKEKPFLQLGMMVNGQLRQKRKRKNAGEMGMLLKFGQSGLTALLFQEEELNNTPLGQSEWREEDEEANSESETNTEEDANSLSSDEFGENVEMNAMESPATKVEEEEEEIIVEVNEVSDESDESEEEEQEKRFEENEEKRVEVEIEEDEVAETKASETQPSSYRSHTSLKSWGRQKLSFGLLLMLLVVGIAAFVMLCCPMIDAPHALFTKHSTQINGNTQFEEYQGRFDEVRQAAEVQLSKKNGELMLLAVNTGKEEKSEKSKESSEGEEKKKESSGASFSIETVFSTVMIAGSSQLASVLMVCTSCASSAFGVETEWSSTFVSSVAVTATATQQVSFNSVGMVLVMA